MQRTTPVILAAFLWVVALVPVVQQLREAVLFRTFQREWRQYSDFNLPQRFAGHTVETRETDRHAMEATVAIAVDGRVVLSPARLRINRDTNTLTRYHRWINQSRFQSPIRNDSMMLWARLRTDNNKHAYDLLTIDKDGRVTVETDIPSVHEGPYMRYRVLSQLGDETPPALPYSEWSIFYVLGGGVVFGVFLSVFGPWIVLVATSVFLSAQLARSYVRFTRPANTDRHAH